MTTPTTPTTPPNPGSQAPSAPPPQPEPRCSLFTTCVDCGLGIELPLPMDQRTFSIMLAQVGWFVAVMTAPSTDPEAKTVIAPLCTSCAQQRFPPEMFQIAEQRRQQLLLAFQQQQQQAAQPPQPAAPAAAPAAAPITPTPPTGTPPGGSR